MKSEVRQFGWMSAAQAGTQVVGLLTSFVLARILDPANFGVVAMALFAALIVRRLLADGVSAYVVSLQDEQPVGINAIALVGLAVAIAASLLMIATALLWGGVLGQNLKHTILAFSGLPIIEAAGAVQNGLIQRRRQFKALAMRTTVASIASAIIGLLVAWRGGGAWALISQQFAQVLVTTVLSASFSRWIPTPTFAFADLVVAGRGFVALSMTSFALVTLGRVDVLFVGALYGASAAGSYAFAKRIVETVRDSIGSALGSVVMSAERHASVGSGLSFLGVALTAVILILSPAAAGLTILARRLIALSLGPTWSGAALPLAILAISIPAQVAMNVCNSALIGAGNRRASGIINLISGATFIALLSLSYIGVTGAAYAFTINAYLSVCVLAFISRSSLIFPPDLRRNLSTTAIAVTVMSASVGAIDRYVGGSLQSGITFGFLVAAGIFLYALLSGLLNLKGILAFWRALRA